VYEDEDDDYYESRRIPRRDRGYGDDRESRWSSYDRSREPQRGLFEELLDDNGDGVPIAPILIATGVLWLIGLLSATPSVGTQTIGF